MSQLRINERLIALARDGLRVVRLKGGDPLVFGRGGEEALALAAASVPFRIIPGISAGIGGTAAAGIPVTHRGLAHSVAFVTGHDTDRRIAGDRLGRTGARSPCAGALHGAAQMGPIAERLLEAGRDRAEPVAFISEATTPRQHVVVTTLADAAHVAAPSRNICRR